MKKFLLFLSLACVASAQVAIDWADVDKTGSSLADLATRSASALNSGTLPDGRFPATLPAASGVNLTALNASNLGSGTVPDARFPATLPAASGVNLTALNASNLGSGTLPAARFPAFTGDVTTSAGAVATTLATVNSNTGSFGSATQTVTVTLDAKGRVTAASQQTVTPAWSSITSKPTAVDGSTTQSANTFYAGPASGSATAPAFRTLAQADVQAASAANRNALTPRGGLFFTANGGKVVSALSSQNLGADRPSVVIVFDVPSSNPAANRSLFSVAATASGSDTTQNSIYAEITTAGRLGVQLTGSPASDWTYIYLDNFVSSYAGKTVVATWVFTGSSAVLYINGEAKSASLSVGGSGTWATSITSSYFVVGDSQGSKSTNGAIRSASLYNLPLSAADVQEIYELGGAVPFRFQFATKTPYYSSDFSATSESWSDANGGLTISGNVDAINSQNDWLSATTTGASGRISIYRNSSLSAAYSGKMLRARARVFIPSGSEITYVGWYWNNTNGTAAPATAVSPNTQYDLDAVWQLPFGMAPNRNGIRATNSSNTSDATLASSGQAMYIKNIIWNQVGAIVHLPLDEGAGYQLQDTSTNRLHALMTSGVAHLLTVDSLQHFRSTSATNGNQQLGGQTVLPANIQVLRIRARARTGTPTITLGSASGGAQLVASVGLTTSWKTLTLAWDGILTSANSLWAASNSTDVVEWDVAWESLNF